MAINPFVARLFFNNIIFERSEFLIDTSPKKNPSVRLCVRLILVLVLGRQTVYGQKTV